MPGHSASNDPRPNVAGLISFRRWVAYLANLSAGRLILWFYFIWYIVVLVRYFDPSPRLWLTSIGLSFIIGYALLINTTRSGTRRVALEGWPTFRLFVTPFCVSSFSALVKGKGFYLIFSPRLGELGAAAAMCAALSVAAALARRTNRVAEATTPKSAPDVAPATDPSHTFQ
jgi:hypothetical protein